NYKITDRVKGVAFSLFERYMEMRIIKRKQLTTCLIAALHIASQVVENYNSLQRQEVQFILDGIGRIGDIDDIATFKVQILLVTCLDLYAATSYDVIEAYIKYYSTVVQDVARTLLQCSYYTSVGRKYTSDVVGMMCLVLGC